MVIAGESAQNVPMPDMPLVQERPSKYKPPVNIQFSVFLDNRVGKMLELLEVFDAPAITLAGISVADATDYAVVRLLTSNSDLARRLLRRHEITFNETDLIVFECPEPMSFARACRTLVSAELFLHYAYPLAVQPRGHACMAVHVDDYVLATELLRKKLFTLMAENDLGDNATGSDPADRSPGR